MAYEYKGGVMACREHELIWHLHWCGPEKNYIKIQFRKKSLAMTDRHQKKGQLFIDKKFPVIKDIIGLWRHANMQSVIAL